MGLDSVEVTFAMTYDGECITEWEKAIWVASTVVFLCLLCELIQFM